MEDLVIGKGFYPQKLYSVHNYSGGRLINLREV